MRQHPRQHIGIHIASAQRDANRFALQRGAFLHGGVVCLLIRI